MAIEIERKFLIRNDTWKLATKTSIDIKQGYLSLEENCTVRVRCTNNQAFLTIKGKTSGISRKEFEYVIPREEADEILNSMCVGYIISKTRHIIEFSGHRWEIDEFFGDNSGLVLAEIELQAEEEAFNKPSWLGEEVSTDPKYFNANLIKTPFLKW